ncbi:aldo/keto reductase [Oscillochloris sp. ZM17-4]|uniref:aldo/keto reductase n=1 Tax=Oscillochloris sp. ZM17-4 TaxID=2866714 RepID=UPI001C739054|nr:aldo/keto reductase [Oscillochloris sp. ZM17-4]MBX0329492.1 aldo/keto reductase [Oscillochloris sp. ZM17-4]
MMPPPAPLAARPLGRTGLSVTPLCIGCAPLASMPDTFYPVSEAQALDALRAVFAGPISFLDTAAAYGDGESERRIGLAMAEVGGLPPGFVLATKADRDLDSGDFSGDQTRRSVERSLRLLGVERLQLVHLHDPEYAGQRFEEIMAPGGAVDVLRQLKSEGLIGAIGIAAGPIDMMMRYVGTGAFDVALTHNRYTLVDRSAEPLLDLAAARGVALLNAAPYGGGMLAKGPDAWGKYMYREAPPELVDRVRRMDAACAGHGVPLAAAALQLSLRDPRIASTIVGITRAERVAQMVELASLSVPDVLWAELAAI